MGWAVIALWKMVISETAQQVNISYAEEKREKDTFLGLDKEYVLFRENIWNLKISSWFLLASFYIWVGFIENR